MRQLRGYFILTLALATGALSLAAARSAPANVIPVACHAGALVAAIHSANANGSATTLVLAADCTGPSPALTNNRVLRNEHTGINIVGGAFTVFPATITGNVIAATR